MKSKDLYKVTDEFIKKCMGVCSNSKVDTYRYAVIGIGKTNRIVKKFQLQSDSAFLIENINIIHEYNKNNNINKDIRILNENIKANVEKKSNKDIVRSKSPKAKARYWGKQKAKQDLHDIKNKSSGVLYIKDNLIIEESKSNIHYTRCNIDVTTHEFLSTYEWRTIRMEAIILHGSKCQCCGASPKTSNVVINVDHIKPRLKFPKLALDINNLQVLCNVCNQGKGNWDKTDWR